MENASKALIIAGAILVSIMIVALGVTIFNKAHSSADTTALDSTEITMFNQKFERFAGDNQSGSNVKSLISFAISNASTNKDEKRKLPEVILLKSENDTSVAAYPDKQNYINNLSSIRSKIKSVKKYKVVLFYSEEGLVESISIQYE